MKLKGMLKEQGCSSGRMQGYYTEVSVEETETVESTSEGKGKIHHEFNIGEGNCCYNLEDYNIHNSTVVPLLPYWPSVPYNYHS